MIGIVPMQRGEPMTDLIERQAAIDEVVNWLKDRMTDVKNGKPLTDRLKDLPSAQPERKKGKWIDKGIISNYPEEGFNIYHLLVCNQCGCMYRTTVWCVNGKYINADFCPNCGAKMEAQDE